jgi:hypothetical protein
MEDMVLCDVVFGVVSGSSRGGSSSGGSSSGGSSSALVGVVMVLVKGL